MTSLRRLRVNNTVIEYKIVRTNRRKTSELFVDSGTVLIRTPSQKSTKEIEGIIKAKADWILRKKEQYQASAPWKSNPTFEHRSLVPYLGVGYPLSIVIDNKFKGDRLRFTNGEFLVSLRTAKNQRKKIRKLYDAWLHQRARTILQQKVQYYASLVGATPRKIVIKNMTNRWGSATKSSVLNFNLDLLKAPEDVLGYIALHELCHLKVRDHSRNFWTLVRRIMPDYTDREKWLSSNATVLID